MVFTVGVFHSTVHSERIRSSSADILCSLSSEHCLGTLLWLISSMLPVFSKVCAVFVYLQEVEGGV